MHKPCTYCRGIRYASTSSRSHNIAIYLSIITGQVTQLIHIQKYIKKFIIKKLYIKKFIIKKLYIKKLYIKKFKKSINTIRKFSHYFTLQLYKE